VDQESISEEELEYECLRSLCDLAIAYRRIAEQSGMAFPRIADTIGYLEEHIGCLAGDFGELEILF
jgi:hypothetical protein